VEEKQGMSRLEQVVEEIFEEEKVKEVKREQKRQKKRARRKEKCKYGDLASNEMSEDCKGSKEGLACEMKNGGEEEGGSCKVETCGERNENELSSSNDHEHCNCSDSPIWNGENSEKWDDESCAGQNRKEGCCFKSECGKSVSCPDQESDQACPEQGRGKSSPREECGESYSQLGCGTPKSGPDLREGPCNEACNHNKSVVGGCYQNGFLSEEMNHDCDDKHDNLPVDDEEKQLLLSMGWNSAEPCQVSADDIFDY
jgi:hypothetical protein